jgi:hypothetical protein
MKTSLMVLVASLAVVACSGSDPSDSPTPSTIPSTPTATASPSTSTGDFCVDRVVIGDVYRLVREGTVSYRQAAAAVVAAGKIMRVDADSAPTDVGARKLRQFALYLNTLRLAILGSVENYPGDFSVKQFTNGLVDRVADISGELDCPPA